MGEKKKKQDSRFKNEKEKREEKREMRNEKREKRDEKQEETGHSKLDNEERSDGECGCENCHCDDCDEDCNCGELSSELEKIKEEKLRLMADFENFRKRMQAERSTFGAIANMSLIQDILEVQDDINLALQDDELDKDGTVSALKNSKDKLAEAVRKSGVERVEINVGDEFDKDKMEALSTIKAGDDKKGKVIAVISAAYRFVGKDEVLKPGKVIVGK